jgi:hypothetical protein
VWGRFSSGAAGVEAATAFLGVREVEARDDVSQPCAGSNGGGVLSRVRGGGGVRGLGGGGA